METFKIFLSEANNWITAYHGGANLAEFNLKNLGKGENNMILGPGVYFATNERIARLYLKYGEDPKLYKAEINMSRIYNPVSGKPESMRGIGDKMAKTLGFDTVDEMPSSDSLKYGKWPIGPIVKHLGVTKALELFREFEIDGLFENLDGDSLEIAVYNMSVIRNKQEVAR